MKIRPVILCGGSGTRLWPNSKKHQAKQFIDFGGWSVVFGIFVMESGVLDVECEDRMWSVK